MLINKATLSSIFISLKTDFNNAFKTKGSKWEKIAMRIKSTAKQNDYGWLSKFPKMRKWIGEKNVKSLEASKYSIVNDDFEATVEVDRNDIEDDNLGIYGPQAQMAGESARDLPDDIVFDLANGAFETECFDGQYFIDTDHPVRSPVSGEDESVSNKLTKKLDGSTLAKARGSIGVALTMIRSFKDDEGRPLDVEPNILLVPVALEEEANLLMAVDKLEDGKPNPFKGKLEVVSSGRLSDPDAWFVLATNQPIKPFIYQERKAPVFVKQTDMESEDVFNRRKFKFGAEARAAGGYGFWQLAVGSTGADA